MSLEQEFTRRIVAFSPRSRAEGVFMQTTMERPLTAEAPRLNQELRIQTDTATWLAETLHGSMRTEFEFNYDGRELRGEDGGSLDPVFDDAIEDAKAMAQWNPSLLFELRRRLTEREELDEMYDMAQGNGPNTMIVVSDFPPELMNANEDVGGYNVNRQQTMLRIITRKDDGRINVVSQSLDGSNRQALEAIYATMGAEAEEGELLGQRIRRDVPPEWQDKLPDTLRNTYDDSLAEQKGGEWHAGISQHPDRNIVNTYEFVVGQQDLLDWFTQQKLADPQGAEKHRYKVAATAKARHERFLREQNGHMPDEISYESFVNVQRIADAKGLALELVREGSRARARGDIFSGCGNTVDAEGSTETQLDSLGYGNRAGKTSANGTCEFVSKQCPGCGERNVKTWSKKDSKTGKTHYEGACGCKA